MAEYEQCSYSLHKAIKQVNSFRKSIKQVKRQHRDKGESQFNSSDTRHMWQGLQTITVYKWKTSHVVDTNILLLDKLNTFSAHFEDHTVPLTRPTTKDSVLSFSVANVNKTFQHVIPGKAAGRDGIPSRVLRA